MNSSDFRGLVSRLILAAWEEAWLSDATEPVVRSAGKGELMVTWDTSIPIMQVDVEPLATYRNFLEKRQYTMLLADYALVQISGQFSGNELVKQRMVYLPCPYPTLVDEIETAGRAMPLLDALEDLDPAEVTEHVHLVSPLRFDFDPKEEAEDHHASHLTVNSARCRVPVNGRLPLRRFVELLVRQYYPNRAAFLEILGKVVGDCESDATHPPRESVRIEFR